MGHGDQDDSIPFPRENSSWEYADCHARCGQLVHGKQGSGLWRPPASEGEGGEQVCLEILARLHQGGSRVANKASHPTGKEDPQVLSLVTSLAGKSDKDLVGWQGGPGLCTWADLFLQVLGQYQGRAPMVTLSRGGAPSSVTAPHHSRCPLEPSQ